MKEILFLTFAEIMDIHRSRIEKYGGSHGLRDINLLQSALAMPESSFGGEYLHEDIFEMAAAYAFHICQNHPFIDGNKRAGLGAALWFLKLNGNITLDEPRGELQQAMMQVASGKMDKKKLAEVFRGLRQTGLMARERRPKYGRKK